MIERRMWVKNEINSAENLIKSIENSKSNALKRVNEELIRMYWNVGKYLSKESEKANFGDAYIDLIVKEIQNAFPGIKGFNRRGLYRMKQFYETYSFSYYVQGENSGRETFLYNPLYKRSIFSQRIGKTNQ